MTKNGSIFCFEIEQCYVINFDGVFYRLARKLLNKPISFSFKTINCSFFIFHSHNKNKNKHHNLLRLSSNDPVIKPDWPKRKGRCLQKKKHKVYTKIHKVTAIKSTKTVLFADFNDQPFLFHFHFHLHLLSVHCPQNTFIYHLLAL